MKLYIKQGIIAVVLMLSIMLAVGGVAYAATWEFQFPIEVTDTSLTSRTYVPVVLGFNGQTLVDNGKIDTDGLDTDMQIATTSIKYMMSTVNVTAVMPLLGSGATQTLDFYTGYSPEQTQFAIVTGQGGYWTVPDSPNLELGNGFLIYVYGLIDTTEIGANITLKDSAIQIYIVSSGNIRAILPTTGENVTATGISKGVHTLEVYLVGGTLSIEVDDVVEDTIACPSSVPDNSNNWTLGQGCSYIDEFKIDVYH